jgi:hypothetical protein
LLSDRCVCKQANTADGDFKSEESKKRKTSVFIGAKWVFGKRLEAARALQ